MDSKEKSSRQSTGCRTTSPLELFPTIPSSSMRREHAELQWKSGKITMGFPPGKQLSYWVRLLAWKVLGNSITGTTYAGATGIVEIVPSTVPVHKPQHVHLSRSDRYLHPSIHPSYISIYLPYPTLPYPTYLRTHVYTRIHIHTYTHIYTQIHTNTHIHA